MRFVLTGTMSMPRKDIIEAIESEGHFVDKKVNHFTDYLVRTPMCNGRRTRKFIDAQRFGTRIITEDELYNILESERTPHYA